MGRFQNLFLKWTLAILVILYPALGIADHSFHVAIISSGKSGIYNDAIQKIKQAIESNDVHKISCELLTLSDPLPKNKNIIDSSDLVLSIGRDATYNALLIESKTPVLATLIPKYSFDELIEEHDSHDNSDRMVSAIYLDSPPKRQLLLGKLLLGDKKSIGVLTTNLDHDSIDELVRTAKQYDLSLKIDNYQPDDNLIKSFSQILNISDAILAIPDPLIYNRNTIRNILLTGGCIAKLVGFD